MRVYDRRIPIHETPEGKPTIYGMIEKLEEMLVQNGIAHAFAFPTDADRTATPKPLEYWLYYDSEQEVETALCVCLFARLHLGKEKRAVLEAIVKSLGRTEAA